MQSKIIAKNASTVSHRVHRERQIDQRQTIFSRQRSHVYFLWFSINVCYKSLELYRKRQSILSKQLTKYGTQFFWIIFHLKVVPQLCFRSKNFSIWPALTVDHNNSIIISKSSSAKVLNIIFYHINDLSSTTNCLQNYIGSNMSMSNFSS